MSRTLILELSDEIHEAILNYSEISGTSPAKLVINSLEKQFGIFRMLRTVNNSDDEIRLARERFEGHFGEVDLGYPTELGECKNFIFAEHTEL